MPPITNPNLTVYGNLIERLTPQERFGFFEDYLQKYDRQILNDQEFQQYEWEKAKVQGLGGAFAVSLPFTMIYVYSTKYDLDHYYPRMIRNLGILGGLAGAWYYVRKQQKQLHQQWVDKYFS